MYYWCDKYYKPITVKNYIAHCVNWVPRPALLDLTNWTYKHALRDRTHVYVRDLLYKPLCPFGVKAFALVFQVSLESLEASSRVNVNWYSHYGEQYGVSLRN